MSNLSADIGVIRTFKFIQNKPWFAIGEFVDNSIQSYIDNKSILKKSFQNYKPRIDIEIDKNLISIIDNCAGISVDDEERAFKVAAPNPNIAGIGTFGMGMKVSACWFGDRWSVKTKNINEDFTKQYEIDVNKILETKDASIGPIKKQSSSKPFTEIKIYQPFQDKIPQASQVKMVKEHISEIYRWFLIEDEIDIFYNGEKLKYEIPSIKSLPYFNDEEQHKIDWFTEIPELDLGDGKKAWGAAYLREKGITSNQKGFSIFWKKRLVTGSAGDPWMPSLDQFDDQKDRDTFAIYGAKNQSTAQRLEGWIHISSNFEVPSTKNGVLWEGKDLVLMKKLKEYLLNCYVSDIRSKKYNFLDQAKKAKWQSKEFADIEQIKIDQALDYEAIKESSEEEKVISIDFNPNETESNQIKEIQINENSHHKILEYEDTKWDIKITIIRETDSPIYTIVWGPDGDITSVDRKMELEINFNHKFVMQYFHQGDGVLERKGIIKFFTALAVAEIIAKETNNSVTSMRRNFNKIMDMEIN